MPAARHIASKNVVMATEHMPAQFRPSNQLRLQPARPANPALHASTNFMPSFLEYQGANQWGDMGLGQRVVKSGNRDLGPKAMPLPTHAPAALQTAPVDDLNNGPGRYLTSHLDEPAPVAGLGTVSRGAPMPGMGSVSRGAPMPGMGALSATNPFVLGGLALGAITAAFLLLRKKRK